MGFIKAFVGSIGGTFADSWIDYLKPQDNITASTLIFGAQFIETNAGRGSNTSHSKNVITNGSKIIVPERTALVTLLDGKVTGCILEPGGYIYSSEDKNSKSFFAGDSIFASLVTQSWNRFKHGGQPDSQHIAIYVNLKEIPGNKFGTQSEIYWDDAYFGAQVGAVTRGTYTLKVVDPILLVKQFVPVEYLTSELNHLDLADMDNKVGEQLFNEVVSTLSAGFSKYSNNQDKANRMSNIQSDQIGFAKSLSEAVEESYQWKSTRGLTIKKVAIIAIEYDAKSKELLNDIQKADALSGSRGNSFMQQSVARGMQAAGENSGEGGLGMAFMGMGMNAAGGVMGTMNQNEQTSNAKNIQDQEEDIYAKLEKLKELLDKGVISQEEFDEVKAKVLEL